MPVRWFLALLLASPACGPSQADGDKSCRMTDGCRLFKKCWYDPNESAYGAQASNGTYESQCVARGQSDCGPGEAFNAGLRMCTRAR